MLNNFRFDSAMLPAEVAAHPQNVQIFGFRTFKGEDWIIIPRTDPDDESKFDFTYFYCAKCKKWLKMSNTIGNINSHIKCVHPETLDTHEMERITEQERVALGRKYILLNGLPFSTAENKYFTKLCPSVGTRKSLSRLCSQVAKDVKICIKGRLVHAKHIYLSADEWSDDAVQRYLGVHAICIDGKEYYNVCLALEPITDEHANAENLKELLKKILSSYNIENRIEGIVTDTAATMVALCTSMGIEWSPCYCHVMNLLMEDIVTSSDEHLHLLFSLQSHLGRSPVFHNYILARGSKTFSLPSHTITRWYSLYKLLKNVHVLRPHIEAFMARPDAPNDIGEIPVAFWDDVKRFLEIFATAKSAMEKMESNEFGTMSQVIDSFRMVNFVVHESLNGLEYADVIQDFEQSYENRWIAYYNRFRSDLIVAARLNPFINTLTEQENADADAVIAAELAEMRDPAQPIRPVRTQTERRTFGLDLATYRGAQVQGIPVNELELYQNKSFGVAEGVDLLTFWKSTTRLPKIASIALKRLLRPATSATAERGFSKAKRVLTPARMALRRERCGDAVLIATNPDIAEEFIH